ncbi:3'(2'),5'-bisphosphate nucleotidase CysQ [Maritimibacter sp. 55A14]|uniref:inositol monophosphatase family protein n=1 Tax=Maritimibacter sp. 55A14 TaxID=2174844 RepID=UPI000D618F38|nr:3'(2'),5'-bisphosphate nucleotidase CysQ [Maritimibacter sp. 55A14]PWE32639.1 3'(2'),5'-bisphosphate nucleotidase CysQ [Maritimibacter sp. 55A14]
MPENDLALLIGAARDAGRIAARHFGQAPATWDKSAGAGPVTEADLEIDRMLRAELTAARPGYGWLSEETPDSADRLDARRVFIVDPIDGTRAFIDGSRAFAHSLAVAEAGRVVAAAVYLPMLDLMFEAAPGTGARLNDAPISVTGATLDGADLLAARPQLDPALWPGGVPPVTRHHRPSLAYRLCLVAQGRFDGMVTLRDAWEWDIAAGSLIVAEAGGQVSDRTGAAFRFNSPRALQPGVVAGGAALHSGLLARLRPG